MCAVLQWWSANGSDGQKLTKKLLIRPNSLTTWLQVNLTKLQWMNASLRSTQYPWYHKQTTITYYYNKQLTLTLNQKLTSCPSLASGSLQLHHHAGILNRVPGGIRRAVPERVDRGWTPDGAPAVPPGTAES